MNKLQKKKIDEKMNLREDIQEHIIEILKDAIEVLKDTKFPVNTLKKLIYVLHEE